MFWKHLNFLWTLLCGGQTGKQIAHLTQIAISITDQNLRKCTITEGSFNKRSWFLLASLYLLLTWLQHQQLATIMTRRAITAQIAITMMKMIPGWHDPYSWPSWARGLTHFRTNEKGEMHSWEVSCIVNCTHDHYNLAGTSKKLQSNPNHWNKKMGHYLAKNYYARVAGIHPAPAPSHRHLKPKAVL